MDRLSLDTKTAQNMERYGLGIKTAQGMDGLDMADILIKKFSSIVTIKKSDTTAISKKSIQEISLILETTENISVVLTPVEEITV